MNRTTRRLKALLTAVAFGACCAYAQIAPPAGFVLPDADPDAAPYDFHMSKTDDGMSVSLTLNRIDRTVTDINNTSHTPLIAIGPGTNQRTLYLNNVPNGLCVISLLIDGKVESTYKLLKQ